MAELTISGVPSGFDNNQQGTPPIPNFPSRAFALTASDVDTYQHPIVVYVGGAGDVAVIPAGGDRAGAETAVTFSGLAAGSYVPCRVKKVLSTGTTATILVGLV